MPYDYRRDAVLGRVLAYWEQQRGSRRMPARRDIDPADLKSALPHLQLIDVVPPGRFRYRLVGTALVDAFGRDYTGRFVDELVVGSSRTEYLTRIYAMTRDNGRPVFCRARYFTMKNVYFLANRVNLPLSENDRDVNMILAALIFESGAGQSLPGMWGPAQLDTVEIVDPA